MASRCLARLLVGACLLYVTATATRVPAGRLLKAEWPEAKPWAAPDLAASWCNTYGSGILEQASFACKYPNLIYNGAQVLQLCQALPAGMFDHYLCACFNDAYFNSYSFPIKGGSMDPCLYSQANPGYCHADCPEIWNKVSLQCRYELAIGIWYINPINLLANNQQPEAGRPLLLREWDACGIQYAINNQPPDAPNPPIVPVFPGQGGQGDQGQGDNNNNNIDNNNNDNNNNNNQQQQPEQQKGIKAPAKPRVTVAPMGAKFRVPFPEGATDVAIKCPGVKGKPWRLEEDKSVTFRLVGLKRGKQYTCYVWGANGAKKGKALKLQFTTKKK